MGGLEVLLITLSFWGAGLAALYWIIRLAVRHGIQDARRSDRLGRSAAGVRETIRRQQRTYGDSGLG